MTSVAVVLVYCILIVEPCDHLLMTCTPANFNRV